MRKTIIVCDTCKTELHLRDGWNDPYYIEVIEHAAISTSTQRLNYYFCSDACAGIFFVGGKQ